MKMFFEEVFNEVFFKKEITMKVLSLMLVLAMTVSVSAAMMVGNIAPSATVTGTGAAPANLVNQVVDPADGLYKIDYSPAGTSCTVRFEWDHAVLIDQFILHKKLGGTPSGYTAPGSTRLWIVDSANAFVQNLYGNYPYGVTENPILQVLTIDFAPVTLAVGQKLQMTCWSPNNNWILMDEVEVHEVPEPATMSLLALGGLAGLLRRRRG